MLLSIAPSKGTFHIDNDMPNRIGNVCIPNLFEVKNLSSFYTLTKATWNTLYTCYHLYSFLFHMILMINMTMSPLSSYQQICVIESSNY